MTRARAGCWLLILGLGSLGGCARPALTAKAAATTQAEGLDPQAVAAKIRQYKGAIVACYESALKRDRGLAGSIMLRFTVHKSGRVSKVEVEDDTMHDDGMLRCLVEHASAWRFPPLQGEAEHSQFAYPFTFRASQ